MLCRTGTVAFLGIKARKVDVQVQMGGGLPAFTIVGLADKAVVESRERIRAAFRSMGVSLPPKRITVNLAPADLPKEGSHFDLPIAVALLGAMEILPRGQMENYMALGELGLDGNLAYIEGALPASLKAKEEKKGLICPQSCGREAAWGRADGDILAPATLTQLVNHFKGTQMLAAPKRGTIERGRASANRLRVVKGQQSAKRALQVAAAGGHNMLMIGPPGVGKSMLAQCLVDLLPPLSAEESLETYGIASLAGQMRDGTIGGRPPFRAPHHSASMAAMVGGGAWAKPGEVALAHHGVLFLDEFAEYPRAVLDSLRQPLETGEITIARAKAHLTYPARFQLIAAMNPCRCGYAGDPSKACGKVPRCVRDYLSKISGPLLDRIDIFVELPALSASHLAERREESQAQKDEDAALLQAIEAARLSQYRRMGKEGRLSLNAHIPDALLDKRIFLEKAAADSLGRAAESMNLSARGYHRVLRVARTIADLENPAQTEKEALRPVGEKAILEALEFRRIHEVGIAGSLSPKAPLSS